MILPLDEILFFGEGRQFVGGVLDGGVKTVERAEEFLAVEVLAGGMVEFLLLTPRPPLHTMERGERWALWERLFGVVTVAFSVRGRRWRRGGRSRHRRGICLEG